MGPTGKKWEVWERGDTGQRHVIPQDDLKPHDLINYCWCNPVDDEGIIVHNSMDKREEYERGERKMS